MDASRAAGLPFRMSEGNSCWNGGQPGVSDTLASALWSADVMLQFAAAGCAGVNMHGGGNGFSHAHRGFPFHGLHATARVFRDAAGREVLRQHITAD